MSDIEAAALRLALFTLAFLAVVLLVWWFRRPKVEHAGPKAPRLGIGGGLAKLRRRDPDVEEVEIAPARLARVSGSAPLAPLPEAEFDDAPQPGTASSADTAATAREVTENPSPVEPAVAYVSSAFEPEIPAPALSEEGSETTAAPEVPADELIEAVALQAEAAANLPTPERCAATSATFAPRFPPHGDAPIHSWLGGRPRLPETMEWPKVDGREGDFLAQISCAALPPMIWDGVGPRSGWLAFFANPDSGAPAVLHLAEDGPPRDPPHPVGAFWSPPGPGLGGFARRAFPEWPIDQVNGHVALCSDVADASTEAYDVADPAFHPFDWDSLTAMIGLLESRRDRLDVDGVAPADASDELAQAVADAAVANRSADARIREIIAVVRESAGQGSFTAAGATAVMEGLQTIRWNEVVTHTDPETGEDLVETLELPLTRHHPAADLWVDDWRALLADHAKHAWCADRNRLPEPLRAALEPEWQRMVAAETVVLGGRAGGFVPSFDADFDAILLHLPASALFNRSAATGNGAIVAIRKSDLAAGNFSRVRMLRRAE
ncbi:DUF1963 domain-containing protein [Sphingopyxis sp. XHP0097]|uniref:DUF1963 domain-containing protein n=1 Tax=Sphingopyxis jiangsuensis TaxID=2871171 RepID=A0ABS7M926_9SPHN|nr:MULTISPECIES: DUF1963 domain-containing protein [Sphingopyxis]MBY4635532.1 DUF1963 domain-containing protein [Sphingopyxis jiangsuensis]